MESDDTEGDPQDAKLHRPPNAFLLFCKQHRSVVRERHPAIENRAVTRILGEWWTTLPEEDKSPYTSLAHQYKEAFMRANPEFRWHKMPPGTADSVPPSNAKPSTPSPANGMACAPVGLLTAAPYPPPIDTPAPSPSAPKPFKKRYLASNPTEPSLSPPSSLSSAGVSPEAARACEALMELARNESCASRSSDGSERRASPSDTPPLQTLREAVWSKVAGTLLKQEEEKLVAPPTDAPMNLTNQCTIRGQQIIEHIIENILSIPMTGPLDPSSEPITFSVNNNQECESLTSRPHHPITLPNGDVGDSIKASIYESLKNDLLKGKVTPTLPTSTGRTLPVATPPATKSSHSSPTVSPTSQRVKAPRKQEAAATSGQDVLRLLGQGQLPINVGNSAITITKTPRVSLPSSPATSFSASGAPPSPVSLSLTRTGPSRGFPASFSLNGGVPVLLQHQSGLVLSSPTNLVLSGRQVPADCVLLSPMQGGMVGQQQQHLMLAGTKLVLAPPTSQHRPPSPCNPTPDPVNLSLSSSRPVQRAATETSVAVKRPPPADAIGEERRSSRTGRGRRYQEFIEDISSTKKKRRSHRSGEEEEDLEVEMEALPTEEPRTSPPPHHWKKQWKQRASSPRGREDPQASPSQLPLAKQEPSTAMPQFDLDAKMEKIEPLKFPDTFAKGRASSGGPGKPPPGQGRGARNSLQERATGHALTTAHPTRAFDSRPNKKSR